MQQARLVAATSNRVSSSPAVTSSTRTTCARAGAPRRAAAPRDRSPRRPASRPRSRRARSRAPSAPSARSALQRERAARRLHRLIARAACAPSERHDVRAVDEPLELARRAAAATSRSGSIDARRASVVTRLPRGDRRRRWRARTSRRAPCAPRAPLDQHHAQRAAARSRSAPRVAGASARAGRRPRSPSAAELGGDAHAIARPLLGLLREHARDQLVERRRQIAARIAPSRGASSSRIFASTAITLSPTNGGCPVRHSNSTQPSANTSGARVDVALAARLLRRHVPGRARSCTPVRVDPRRHPSCARRRSRAPSRARGRPSGSKMFDGLMSRWTTPRACAAPERLGDAPRERDDSRAGVSASRARCRSPEASRPRATPSRATSRRRVVPPRRRSARCPGCRSPASTRISRANRSRASRASPFNTFIATRSPVARSRARNTIPMPPAPACASSSNRPSTTSPGFMRFGTSVRHSRPACRRRHSAASRFRRPGHATGHRPRDSRRRPRRQTTHLCGIELPPRGDDL